MLTCKERGESWCAKEHLELCIVMAADFVFEAQKAGRLLSVHVHFCFFFLIMWLYLSRLILFSDGQLVPTSFLLGLAVAIAGYLGSG